VPRPWSPWVPPDILYDRRHGRVQPRPEAASKADFVLHREEPVFILSYPQGSGYRDVDLANQRRGAPLPSTPLGRLATSVTVSTRRRRPGEEPAWHVGPPGRCAITTLPSARCSRDRGKSGGSRVQHTPGPGRSVASRDQLEHGSRASWDGWRPTLPKARASSAEGELRVFRSGAEHRSETDDGAESGGDGGGSRTR
jgi:hypothetical protein